MLRIAIVSILITMVYVSGCDKLGIEFPVSSQPEGGGQAAGASDAKTVQKPQKIEEKPAMEERIVKSDAEWRKQLDPMAYQVLRKQATEQAYTGKYWNHKEIGTYRCAGCGAVLFESATKFDSGCGWPSFYAAAENKRIIERDDRSHNMLRTEVLCAKCRGHLGHVFKDGPAPTGLRYCINSAALVFEAKKE